MERIEVYSSRLLQRQERTYIPISVSPKRRERGKSVWGVRPFSTMRISWEPSYSSTQGLVLSYEELACCFLHRGHLQISISWRVAHLRYCHYLCGKKEEFLILVFPRAVEQGASVQKPLFCCLQMRQVVSFMVIGPATLFASSLNRSTCSPLQEKHPS